MKRTAAALVLGLLAAVVPGHAQRATIPATGPDPAGPNIRRWQTLLRIEDARDPTPVDLGLLMSYARRDPARRGWSSAIDLQDNALRALGRLERLELVPALKEFLGDAVLRPYAEIALLLTLRAHASDTPDALVVETVDDLIAMPADPVVLGNLPLNRPDQFAAIDERLRAALRDPKAVRDARRARVRGAGQAQSQARPADGRIDRAPGEGRDVDASRNAAAPRRADRPSRGGGAARSRTSRRDPISVRCSVNGIPRFARSPHSRSSPAARASRRRSGPT